MKSGKRDSAEGSPSQHPSLPDKSGAKDGDRGRSGSGTEVSKVGGAAHTTQDS